MTTKPTKTKKPAEQVVKDTYLADDLGYGPNDPLFPATRTGFDQAGATTAPTLSRECWTTADPIRAIFKAAFAGGGLPYFNPHSFRHTLARLATSRFRTYEELISWSQNLEHAGILTTLVSYGSVPFHRQRTLILAAGQGDEDTERALELGRAMLATLRAKEEA